MAYLLDWHARMCGREPLSFVEIEAWSRITRRPLRGWEADAIRAIDLLYFKVLND